MLWGSAPFPVPECGRMPVCCLTQGRVHSSRPGSCHHVVWLGEGLGQAWAPVLVLPHPPRRPQAGPQPPASSLDRRLDSLHLQGARGLMRPHPSGTWPGALGGPNEGEAVVTAGLSGAGLGTLPWVALLSSDHEEVPGVSPDPRPGLWGSRAVYPEPPRSAPAQGLSQAGSPRPQELQNQHLPDPNGRLGPQTSPSSGQVGAVPRPPWAGSW